MPSNNNSNGGQKQGYYFHNSLLFVVKIPFSNFKGRQCNLKLMLNVSRFKKQCIKSVFSMNVKRLMVIIKVSGHSKRSPSFKVLWQEKNVIYRHSLVAMFTNMTVHGYSEKVDSIKKPLRIEAFLFVFEINLVDPAFFVPEDHSLLIYLLTLFQNATPIKVQEFLYQHLPP